MSERKILLVCHRITVDGKVVYEGGEWGEHGRDVYRIVMDAIARPSRQVLHQILKQVVCLDADPPLALGQCRRRDFNPAVKWHHTQSRDLLRRGLSASELRCLGKHRSSLAGT